MTETKTLDEIVRRTLNVFPQAERIVLFGSRSRGDERSDSDYDILVVTPTALRNAERVPRLRAALRGLNAPFDLIVVTPEELAHRRDWQSTAVARAFEEGTVLHGNHAA